jgi:hypothetical protein
VLFLGQRKTANCPDVESSLICRSGYDDREVRVDRVLPQSRQDLELRSDTVHVAFLSPTPPRPDSIRGHIWRDNGKARWVCGANAIDTDAVGALSDVHGVGHSLAASAGRTTTWRTNLSHTQSGQVRGAGVTSPTGNPVRSAARFPKSVPRRIYSAGWGVSEQAGRERRPVGVPPYSC